MIVSLQLLTQDECERTDQQLKALREHWTSRGGPMSSFYTLGAASYLDEPEEYRARAARANPVLREHFGWLYERVVDFLSRRLLAPVSFAEELGVPGFHVWEAPSIFTTPEASVHFDLQYLRTWPKEAPDVDFSHPLSFTLPIRLPRRGGGLNAWDVTYERFLAFQRRLDARCTAKDVTVLLPRMRFPYTVGALALHGGHMLHQIGEVDAVFPGDERITLQGHALCRRGEWKLYW